MWPVSGGTWTLTASHPQIVHSGATGASRLSDGAVAQFTPSRVTYGDKSVRTAHWCALLFATACQRGERSAINHHTFDQNAEKPPVFPVMEGQEGRVRSCSANWFTAGNGHLDGR